MCYETTNWSMGVFAYEGKKRRSCDGGNREKDLLGADMAAGKNLYSSIHIRREKKPGQLVGHVKGTGKTVPECECNESSMAVHACGEKKGDTKEGFIRSRISQGLVAWLQGKGWGLLSHGVKEGGEGQFQKQKKNHPTKTHPKRNPWTWGYMIRHSEL